ncbi:MAG: dihydrofolate reductase [Clostridiales bacterium]|nr:dihydrofolate reductase [Clostridiales bacterium]
MNLIVSIDQNWGIGKENHLLFHVDPDLRFFQKQTRGGIVIMGRMTMESLPAGSPLAGRMNIVLSRTPERIVGYPISGKETPEEGRFFVCKSLTELRQAIAALPQMDRESQVWVIGGSEIYRQLAPFCRYAYVTKFLALDTGADCRVQDFDKEDGWALVESSMVMEWNGLAFTFCRYRNHFVRDFVIHSPNT